LVFCLRDLETAVLFYPPGGEPLTVRIFTLEANGPVPVVAGLGVIHAAVTGAVLALGAALLLRRRST
jgi:iron(III) transport system permease protein